MYVSFGRIDEGMGTGRDDFFIAGGTLRPDSGCYVVRACDSELRDALRRREYCYVLDSRQKGKSSLMARAIHELTDEGVLCCKLDLQRFGSNLDPDRWYASLLNALGEDTNLSTELFDHWSGSQQLGPLHRWVSAIEHVLLPLLERSSQEFVIFVDEVDYVRSLPFSTDEFFAGIRELYNRRSVDRRFERISFCFLGVATPSELIRDVRITPFNVGRRIELTDFTLDECAPFAQRLGMRGHDLVKRIHYWTGGHPYLTQKLCQAVCETSNATAKTVDRLVEELFFTRRAREEEPNLRDVSRRVLEGHASDRDDYLADILLTLERVRLRRRTVRDDESDPVVAALKLSGLTRVVEGYLWIRNRIYYRAFDQLWIRSNLPNAEAKRLRAAARVATIRTSAVAGLVVMAVGGLAIRSNLLANENAWLAETRKVALDDAEIARKTADREADAATRSAHTRLLAEQRATLAAEGLRKSLVSEARARKFADLSAAGERKATARALEAARIAEVRRLTALAEETRANAAATRERGEKLKAQRLTYIANMNLLQAAYQSENWVRAHQLLQEAHQPVYAQFSGIELGYWEAQLNSYLRKLDATSVSVAAFEPRGKYVVVGLYDGTIALHDLSSGMVVKSLPLFKTRITSLDFSDDGSLLALGALSGEVSLVATSNWSEIGRMTVGSEELPSIALNANGTLLLAVQANGRASVWDTRTRLAVITHETPPVAVSGTFLRDGSGIVLSCQTSVHLWKFGEADEDHDLAGQAVVSPDQRHFVALDRSSYSYLFRDVQTGKTIGSPFKGRPTFSSDGLTYAVVSDTNGIDVYLTGSHERVFQIPGRPAEGGLATVLPTATPKDIDFSSDGRLLLATYSDGRCIVWNSQSNPLSIVDAHFSGTHSVMLRGSRQAVAVWGPAVTVFEPAGAANGAHYVAGANVMGLARTKDGSLIAAGDFSGTTTVLRTADLSVVATIAGGRDVGRAAFSSDGKWLAVGSGEKAEVWSVSGKLKWSHTMNAQSGMKFIDEDERILVGDGAVLTVLRASDGSVVRSLRPPYGSWLFSISPNGKDVAVSGMDGTVSVLRLADGAVVATFRGQDKPSSIVQFTANGSRLVSVSLGGHIRVWDVASEREVLSLSVDAPRLGGDVLSMEEDYLILGDGAYPLRRRAQGPIWTPIDATYVARRLEAAAKAEDAYAWEKNLQVFGNQVDANVPVIGDVLILALENSNKAIKESSLRVLDRAPRLAIADAKQDVSQVVSAFDSGHVSAARVLAACFQGRWAKLPNAPRAILGRITAHCYLGEADREGLVRQSQYMLNTLGESVELNDRVQVARVVALGGLEPAEFEGLITSLEAQAVSPQRLGERNCLLGALLLRAGKLDQAVQVLSNAIKSGLPSEYGTLGRLYLALAQAYSGDRASALTQLDQFGGFSTVRTLESAEYRFLLDELKRALKE